MNPSRFLCALLLLAFATSCRQESAKPNPSNVSGPAAAVQTTTYHGVGVVKSINLDPKQPSIEIDHENIPGLMEAMLMEFHVRDRSLLNGIKPGDRVDFTMEYGVGGLKITEIRKR